MEQAEWARVTNRIGHARSLSAKLQDAESSSDARRRQRPEDERANGIYVTFQGFPGIELALTTLDPKYRGRQPELLTVRTSIEDSEEVQWATVYIPDGKLGYFIKRLSQYIDSVSQDTPRNRNLVERIADVALTSLRQLWTDDPQNFPDDDQQSWWEVWLRVGDDDPVARLKAFVESRGLLIREHILRFPDRIVAVVRSTPNQLAEALDVLDDLAELRRPNIPMVWLTREARVEQAQWVDDLIRRTNPPLDSAPAACLLDTGVHRSHPLIQHSLRVEDCHTCDPAWGLDDHDRHGTEMAGLALYRDLSEALSSGNSIQLRHRLESVKLLPPPPQANDPDLYGAVTATAASLVEIERPNRRRAFCLPISSRYDDDVSELIVGQPTSWSAAIDALAAGLAIDVSPDGLVFLDEGESSAQRLFLLAAGNVSPWEDDHLSLSDLQPVEDPGQSWNALTVGAHTELIDMQDVESSFAGWVPIAPLGDLSPHSRTSVAWEQRRWPIKPDVVLEGGNVARSPMGTDFDTPDVLQLVTTRWPREAGGRLLTTTCATSAATAQAAWLAAEIFAEFPSLWPETARALIVHSAEWTPAMKARFDSESGRAQRVSLRRRYGMGVPDLARATRSATDALTLVVEELIHPFDEGRTREMHLHDLPWPTDVLADLGAVETRMRVTLSYFIQPNPSRRGWVSRYQYPSHGLRFEVRRPTESTPEFRRRINDLARSEEERRPSSEGDPEWLFGPRYRASGSLHTDIWRGTAADLAQRGVLAVFPVSGWWKDQPKRDRSDDGVRYSLIVSIETPEVDVDIWTPVAQEVGVPIEISN